MKTKNFRKKVTLACGSDELRPIMEHIYFDEGNLVCTDAHILLIQSLEQHGFTEAEVEIMNGKFLHRASFDEIFRYDHVTVSEDGFTCRKNSVECLIKFSKSPGDYVNYKAVIPTGELGSIDEIGINLNLLARANKITLSPLKGVKFRFRAKNKAIILNSVDEFDSKHETILIMPVMLM